MLINALPAATAAAVTAANAAAIVTPTALQTEPNA